MQTQNVIKELILIETYNSIFEYYEKNRQKFDEIRKQLRQLKLREKERESKQPLTIEEITEYLIKK